MSARDSVPLISPAASPGTASRRTRRGSDDHSSVAQDARSVIAAAGGDRTLPAADVTLSPSVEFSTSKAAPLSLPLARVVAPGTMASPTVSFPGPADRLTSRYETVEEAGGNAVRTLCLVIQEMLQMKYGLALDAADFVGKVAGSFRIGGAQVGQPVGGLSPAQLVAQLSAQPDLHLRLCGDSGNFLCLRVDSHETRSFEELRREVSRMPGTMRALALADTTMRSGGARPTAVAVFREDYSNKGLLVGRCGSLASMPPLLSFNASDLRSAVVLDPEVTRMFQRRVKPGGQELEDVPVPTLREEYSAWLMPESDRSSQSKDLGHTNLRPWSRTGDDTLKEPSPTQPWLTKFRGLLDHPNSTGEALLPLLQQLMTWFEGSSNVASTVRDTMLQAGIQASLVGVIRRFSLASARPRPDELAAASVACRVVGLACRGFPEGAAAFTRACATPALCMALRQQPQDLDAQRCATFALRCLLEEDPSSASAANEMEVAQIVKRMLIRHPNVPDLHRDGSRLVQCLQGKGGHSQNGQEPSTPSKTPTRRSEAPQTTQQPVQAWKQPSLVSRDSSDDETRPSRRGIGEALMEKRAAAARESSRGSGLSAAVGWLFSGSRENSRSAANRQGTSAPPGRRAPPATPPVPGSLPSQSNVPPIDLRKLTAAITSSSIDPARIWHGAAESRSDSPPTPPAVKPQQPDETGPSIRPPAATAVHRRTASRPSRDGHVAVHSGQTWDTAASPPWSDDRPPRTDEARGVERPQQCWYRHLPL